MYSSHYGWEAGEYLDELIRTERRSQLACGAEAVTVATTLSHNTLIFRIHPCCSDFSMPTAVSVSDGFYSPSDQNL